MGLACIKKVLIFCILFALFSAVAHSAVPDFSVDYKAVKNRIYLNGTAEFIFNISNNLNYEESFLLYPGEVEWDVTTVPSKDKRKAIGPKSSETVRVQVRPTQDFWPNLYGVSIKVKNPSTKEVISKEVLIEILGKGEEKLGSYLPAVKAEVQMPERIDPRNNIPVKILLINQNKLDLQKLNILLKSNLINKEYETSLEGLETKKLDFNINLDPLTEPRQDILNVDIVAEVDGESYEFKAPSVEFSVISYGKVEEEAKEKSSFLKKEKIVTLRNKGNIDKNYLYKTDKGLLSGLFISAFPEPSVERIDENTYFVWRGKLEKEQSHNIKITYNYRWLFYLLVIAVILAASYFILRSPVLITKSSFIVGKSEGGVSDLTVQLHIKNRSNRPLHLVEIKDKVPNLMQVIHEFNVGTLQPSKILKHEKRGTILKWDIEELDSFEERIISYKVHARLSILGDFSLPRAVIKFKKDKIGSYNFAHSNRLRMSYN